MQTILKFGVAYIHTFFHPYIVGEVSQDNDAKMEVAMHNMAE